MHNERGIRGQLYRVRFPAPTLTGVPGVKLRSLSIHSEPLTHRAVSPEAPPYDAVPSAQSSWTVLGDW